MLDPSSKRKSGKQLFVKLYVSKWVLSDLWSPGKVTRDLCVRARDGVVDYDGALQAWNTSKMMSARSQMVVGGIDDSCQLSISRQTSIGKPRN